MIAGLYIDLDTVIHLLLKQSGLYTLEVRSEFYTIADNILSVSKGCQSSVTITIFNLASMAITLQPR